MTLLLTLKPFILLFIFLNLFSKNLLSASLADGDLTRQVPVEKIIYFKGEKGENHFFDPNILYLKTGKLYKLKLINQSDSKHYFTSDKFTKSIFTRKIQVVGRYGKIGEIKGRIDEVEVYPNHSIEWWFIPLKTGKFNDLQCSIIDEKKKIPHSEMGMSGSIIIE